MLATTEEQWTVFSGGPCSEVLTEGRFIGQRIFKNPTKDRPDFSSERTPE
jgi:hypothetical protein